MKKPKTQLGQWMAFSTPRMKHQVAQHAGVTVNYLYLMGDGIRENPGLRLALKLVEAIHDVNKEAAIVDGIILPRVTLHGLATASGNGNRIFEFNGEIVSQHVR